MQKKDRLKNFSSTKILALIFLTLGFVTSLSVLYICWKVEKRKIPLKEELVRKEETLENYQYMDGKYRGGKGLSIELCRLSMKKEGDFMVSSSTMDGFHRTQFEQEVELGDELVIFIDEKSKTDGCYHIAEIWKGETCYLNYETYVSGLARSKKDTRLMKWLGVLSLLVFGNISYYIWSRNKNE